MDIYPSVRDTDKHFSIAYNRWQGSEFLAFRTYLSGPLKMTSLKTLLEAVFIPELDHIGIKGLTGKIP